MKSELKESPQTKNYLQYTNYANFLQLKRLNIIMEQVIKYAMQKDTNQFKVLDLGCGIGGFTFPLSSLGYKVVGVDIDSESISSCKNRNNFPYATYIVGNAETIDLQEKFDVVIASEVMEHCFQPNLVIQTIAKHLNEGGIGIVSVPNGYCFSEILFSRFFQKLGIISLFHKMPKKIYTSLTGSPSPFYSLNVFCHHVQFFSFGKFKSLLNSGGFQVSLVRNLDLGILLDWALLTPVKRIECKLAESMPHFLAGGWVFVIRREDK